VNRKDTEKDTDVERGGLKEGAYWSEPK